ncbi:hypothetical protein JTB14_007527 [Gonioctena quinquepunctata]|nr:hypothetical protein JTB14_007527 [Gonioctena quinquepunctata]
MNLSKPPHSFLCKNSASRSVNAALRSEESTRTMRIGLPVWLCDRIKATYDEPSRERMNLVVAVWPNETGPRRSSSGGRNPAVSHYKESKAIQNVSRLRTEKCSTDKDVKICE